MQVLETATQISFKNILFLTDFTEASEAALSYAQGFARHYGAELYPAHACEPIVLTETPSAEIVNQIVEGTRQQLTKFARENKINGISLFAEGSVETAFPKWVKENGIDLVVVGTHGKRGLQHFLLGSTAEFIFRNSPCPVLTVGPHVNFRPRNGFTADNILFPTDLGTHAAFASTYAFSFARESHGRITLMHVVPLEPEFQHDREAVVAGALKKIKTLVPSDALNWCQPEFQVEIGDPAIEVLTRANADRPDLIVLGLPYNKKFNAHLRTGVTYKLVSSAPCPVLTVRDLAPE
jgi:nucleotide-binding universal stress UspA family protein